MVDTGPPAKSSVGQRLALLAVAQFIITLDFNIVIVALPDIGRGLGFTTESLQWVISAYVVALGGLLLFGGRAADRLGARRMFILGLLIYAASSLTGGLAHAPGVLIGARAAQGLGGSLLMPATLRLIFFNFTEGPQRNRALVIYGAVGGAGLSAGALLGGVFTDYFGWQWVFYVNVPLAVLAALVAPRVLPKDVAFPGGRRSFDLPGALLATGGATLVVFGLASGPATGWTAPRVVGTIAGGAVLLAAFLVVEKLTKDPLAPLRLFRHRSLAVTMGVAFVYQGALGGIYYLFTTYLQDSVHYSPLSAGMAFLPPTVISMLFATKFTTPMLNKLGLRATLFTGVLVTAVGTAGMIAGFTDHGSYWKVLPGLAVWAIGGAMAVPALFAGAGAGVSLMEQGVASAMGTTARQIGGAVGLAALVAVSSVATRHSAASGSALAALDHGLRTAGWVAAGITLVGAFIALAMAKPRPQPAAAAKPVPPPATAVDEAEVSATS